MSLPEKLGRYEIIGELGKGAMGIVYRARDPLIGRQLALKTFRLGYSAGDQELEQFRERFLREAQSAGILSHRNIVAIHDVAVDPEGDFFIAMEFVKGTDLKLVMQRQGRLEPSFAVEVVAQIADGLGYAHSKGVVHRDIKPANIMITADKEAKITDFGIARVEASNLTVEGQLLGTPNYMAPEQIQGKPVDHRADIFSLGVMLFELLTGKKPFAAPNLSAVTHKIVFEPYPPLEQEAPGLPAGFAQVLDRALAKDPAERYDRGDDMAADLRAIYAPEASPSATGAIPVASRSGSFLDRVPAASAAPTGALPTAGVPAAGVPVPLDGGTVAAGAAAVPAVGDGTVVNAAPATAAGAGPAAATPAAMPAPTTAPPVAGEAGGRGMPVAGRIAAAIGLVLAISVVGIGISKLTGDAGEASRAEAPELERRQEPQPLAAEGREPLEAGQPADDPAAYVAQRLEAAREALRARDYPTGIRLAEEALAVDPGQQEGKELLAEAREGQQRRQEIRDRLRNPPSTPPATGAQPSGTPATARPAAPPAAAPEPPAEATLVIALHSEASEGRLTIFTGQKKIYQQPFKFVTGKSGVFSRQRGTSGDLRDRLTLPSGDHDLRIYVWRKDAQTRSTEVAGNLPPGGSRTLKIEVTEEGRVSAALE